MNIIKIGIIVAGIAVGVGAGVVGYIAAKRGNEKRLEDKIEKVKKGVEEVVAK
ncbi:MAG: hypothetical protein LBT97_03035 [Planctomycetota bacterium]|jgi:uncharacterized protein (DUF2062 family)|nr:hypothetical protein [Planctomycetota bacterium]